MTTGAPAPMQPPPGGSYPPTASAAPKPADPAKSAAIMLLVAAALILVGTVSKNWVSGGRGSKDIHIGPLGGEACMGSVCVDIPTRGVPGDIEAIMVIALISGFASAAAAATFGGLAFANKTDKIPVPPKLAHMAFGLAAFSMTFFLIRMISEKGEISWAGFPAIAGVVLAGIGLKKLTPFLAARPALPPGAQQSQGMQPQQQYGSQPYQQQPYQQQPYQQQPYQQQPYSQQSQGMPPQQPNQSQPMHPYANQSQPMQPQQQYGSQPYAQQPQVGPPAMPPQAPAQQVHNCPRCGTQLQFVAQYQRWFCPREQQYV
ncbi:MAG TPA: hypothetical protein VIV40_36465 [Kofleriaceae bacterium]